MELRSIQHACSNILVTELETEISHLTCAFEVTNIIRSHKASQHKI